MAKLGGPLMSMTASGTVGGIITFATWKGRPYVRTRVIPSNPKSAAQLGVRAMMTFLSQQWAGLDPADKTTWEVAADARKVSPFNAFVSANQGFWRDGLAPGKLQTLLRADTPAVISASGATPSGRYISGGNDLAAGADNWGIVVYVSTTTGFTPAWNNARLVLAAAGGSSPEYLIGPLASATYYCRYHSFSVDGKWDKTYVDQDTVIIP